MDIYAKITGTDTAAIKGFADAASAAAQGYSPYREEPMPEESPGAGKVWYPTYVAADGAVVRIWEARAIVPSPRSFSKRKLYAAFMSRSLWTDVRSYMETAGVWDTWLFATTLDEDDPLMRDAIAALTAQLGSEAMNAILAEGVAD